MEKNKPMLLIVNPKSGKGQIKNKLLEIVDVFVKSGYEVTIYTTQKALDAKEKVLSCGNDYDLVVCSGGDGTLNETISGLMELSSPPELGYIPTGSTNDFASSLRIPKRTVSAAVAAARGKGYPVDIGKFCDDRYFVYVAGFGAFTEVSYLTSQDKKNILGHQAYMLESVKSLTTIRSYKMKITGDRDAYEGEFIFGMVTNTISVGGFKGLVNQNVALNDGYFEVLLIRTPKTPLELTDIVSGLLLKDGRETGLVYKFKTKSLHIESEENVDWVLDGEYGGNRKNVQIDNLCRQIKIRIM